MNFMHVITESGLSILLLVINYSSLIINEK